MGLDRSGELRLNEVISQRAQRVSEPVAANQVYSPQGEEAHLRDYWRVVVKYRRLICILSLTIVCFGAYIISGATPMYTAAATVKIDPQNPAFTNIAEVLKIESSGDYVATQHELIRSRALAGRVISELGLESDRAFMNVRIVNPDPIKWVNAKLFGSLQSIIDTVTSIGRSSQPKAPQPPPVSRPELSDSANENSVPINRLSRPAVNPGLVGRYLSFLKVEPVKGTRLVKIMFTTPDPNLSQRLTNAHAAAFVRMNMETRFEVTKEARKFLEQKLSELRTKIEEAEAELSEFRRAHGVVSMERGENLIVDRMIALNTSLTSARIRRLELESLRQMLDNKNPADLTEVMQNSTITQYRTSIENLTAEQVKLSMVFKPDHPRMIELNTRITETRQRMKAAIAEVVHRIQTDYDTARNREVSLEAEASRQKEAAINLKSLGIRYTVLQGKSPPIKRFTRVCSHV